MTPDYIIDLGRNAIAMMLLVSAPALITALGVGLLMGVLQTLTQIQEQTISFVPKIVAVVLVLSFMLPWIVTQLVQYSQDLIRSIPANL